MIGLDTNVLVRLLTADDENQLEAATRMMTPFEGIAHSFYINDMVLVELVWVLRRLYGFAREDCLLAIQALLNSDAYAFEDRARLAVILNLCKEQEHDFADAMIVFKNTAASCEYTATFDKAMSGLLYVKVI
ncbi:MAG: type II toxin-antitoxin system VapC family toxin [Methyloglobulus sp.]|nr:type II toxin-antitoxin system VapC family toxin [Methyloglobulus sp.]